ncbi:MAG: VCBS repeat-containing protein [Flavobacteriales bacterium]|nr:VCBS repeat-containing protein [Flavobacteriales bacterium]
MALVRSPWGKASSARCLRQLWSIWVDYDGDGDMDLFVAKCGCDPVDILMRNNGDGTFTSMAAALGFADSHQSWSSAWGDFNNDGDMDVLVSAPAPAAITN